MEIYFGGVEIKSRDQAIALGKYLGTNIPIPSNACDRCLNKIKNSRGKLPVDNLCAKCIKEIQKEVADA